MRYLEQQEVFSLQQSTLNRSEREKEKEKSFLVIFSFCFIYINKFVHQASHASRFVARMIRIRHAACSITSLLTLVYSHRHLLFHHSFFRDEIYDEFLFLDACSIESTKRTRDTSNLSRIPPSMIDRWRSGGLLIDQTWVISDLFDEEERRRKTVEIRLRHVQQIEESIGEWNLRGISRVFSAKHTRGEDKRECAREWRRGGGELMPTRWIYLWSIRLEDRRVCLIEATCIC